MKTVVFVVLTVVLTGCQCNPFETFDIADTADTAYGTADISNIADTADFADYDPEEEVAPHSGLQWGSSKVAFMSILDKRTCYGNNQHIKFKRVLLNDGKAYEPSTGVFRAPRSGVYRFTFVFAVQCCKCEVRVRLVVNGITLAGAVAEGRHCGQDVMGGNTAVVKVDKGKSVWVETVMGGCINGRDQFTTFSGSLVYKK